MGRFLADRRVVMIAAVLEYLSVWGGQYAHSANVATTQDVIDQWRSLFPNEPYVCWKKGSPWDGLDKLQSPPAGVKTVQTISVDMGRNEYESASFVLTNLSDKPMEFEITYDPSGISTTLRKAVWVIVNDGSEVNDALSLINDGRVVIPSGESLEIWITLHGNDVAAGRYNQTINVLPRGREPRVVDVSVAVHDLSLPANMPVDLQYWDDVVPAWMTPESAEAVMKDLKSHYVNNATLHPWPLPKLAVDADGQLVTDYAEFDRTLDAYRTLAPKRFIFYWNPDAYLEPGGDVAWHPNHPESKGRPEFWTPEWKNLFREWLTGLVAHMKDRGIGYDAFAICPYDEQGGPKVQAMIKFIKEVDPNIPLLFNSAFGRTVEELEIHIAPYTDIWLPYLYRYIDDFGGEGYISQPVSLDPDTAYTFSFYGKNGGTNIYYDLIFDGSTNRRAQLLDAADWRLETHSFTTASDTTQVQIRFFPTVGNRTILIDDVVLRSGSGSNLVVNGDMEKGNPPGSWLTNQGATIVANTTDLHSGRQCAEATKVPDPPGPAREAAKRLLGPASGKLFWTYANPMGIGPTRASPYHYYRLPVWRAWKEGMTGFGYWRYGGGRWDSTGKSHNWGVTYRSGAADCPAEVSKQEHIVPSKRWEATREGVEDYVYLYLLRSAISDSPLAPRSRVLETAKKVLAFWTKEVLKKADNDNAKLAGKAKTEIIKAILELTLRH